MKSEIKVPPMGESISEATVGAILIPNGSFANADEGILELETDKVNQLLYAPHAGVVDLKVQTGDTVKIGQVLGTVDGSAQEKKSKEIPTPAPVEPQPPKEAPKEKKREIATRPDVKGSQEPSIRQTKEDFIEEFTKSSNAEAQAIEKKQPTAAKGTKERETRRKMSNIRKVIARRLVEAQQTAAMLTTFNEIDLSSVVQMREKHKESFMNKFGVKLGFMSFFVEACVSALQAYPDLNSYIEGEDIVHREYYDIGVAIGSERGLIVPVIRDCDQLTFADIEKTIHDFATKAKEGTLAVSDLQGGGFTITNGGVYGSLLSTPILNPPQSGILGMHKIEKRAVVIEDQIQIRPMMYVALSYDHRIVDGKEAVSFLVHIKNLLEDPSRLLLDI